MIVGNEPNLNRFWLPQFDLDGSEPPRPRLPGAARADVRRAQGRLARVQVYGGAVSPRGGDRPAARPTHSPTLFIRDLGLAYRASGRDRPVMDAFVIHPYADNSSQSPTAPPAPRAIGVADYGKLVALLGEAFDGTAQAGSALPIFYGEFGVESQIPAAKESLYTGTEPTTTKPVDEATQAAYYEQALALAFCQPTVGGMLLFLSRTSARASWQSGVHYVDGTPKKSRPRVTEALDRTTGGSITRCPGVELPVRATYLRFGTRGPRSAACSGSASLRPRLPLLGAPRERRHALDEARGEGLGRGGRARPGRPRHASSHSRHVPYTIRLIHPVNPRRADPAPGPRFSLP